MSGSREARVSSGRKVRGSASDERGSVRRVAGELTGGELWEVK